LWDFSEQVQAMGPNPAKPRLKGESA